MTFCENFAIIERVNEFSYPKKGVKMANLESAKTRVKRNKKREKINATRLNAVRTDIKKTRAAIAKKDQAEAQKAFKKAESSLAKAKGKRTIKANTASRLISRLAKAVKNLAAKK